MAVGAQVGSVMGCLLTVAGGPLAILGLLAGSFLGGWSEMRLRELWLHLETIRGTLIDL